MNIQQIKFDHSNFKQDCLKMLLTEDTDPLILVLKTKGAIAVSISKKLQNREQIKNMLFQMISNL